MSRIVHRQPVWTWSLVLFSALLLTPGTAALVLSALKQANVAVAPRVETPCAPRRATVEEEEAIKAAVGSGRLKQVATTSFAVLTPERVTIALPDSPVLLRPARGPTLSLREGAPTGLGCRAPPVHA